MQRQQSAVLQKLKVLQTPTLRELKKHARKMKTYARLLRHMQEICAMSKHGLINSTDTLNETQLTEALTNQIEAMEGEKKRTKLQNECLAAAKLAMTTNDKKSMARALRGIIRAKS
jgi:hypothetical protein